MSKSDGMRQSVEEESKQVDELIRKVKEISDSAPKLEQRKRETEAKRIAINNMPEDVLEENAPRLLLFQQHDKARLASALDGLEGAYLGINAVTSTSGSASVFSAVVEVVGHATSIQGPVPDWARPVQGIFVSLAEEKARQEDLPLFLEQLHPSLGDQLRAALDSFEKAQSGIVGVDQAANRLRSVIQQVWGNLVAHARQQCEHDIGARPEFRTSSDREKVAKCLAKPDSFKVLVASLDELWELYKELSPEAKKIFGGDMKRLKELKAHWLLQLDRLRGLIDL